MPATTVSACVGGGRKATREGKGREAGGRGGGIEGGEGEGALLQREAPKRSGKVRKGWEKLGKGRRRRGTGRAQTLIRRIEGVKYRLCSNVKLEMCANAPLRNTPGGTSPRTEYPGTNTHT
eukprot:355730-Chlamydomonas_euryale.AAC.4